MQRNVGNIDRLIRVFFGLALLGAGVYAQSWWGLVGLVPLLTAALGRCPAYLPFGINTCRLPQGKTPQNAR